MASSEITVQLNNTPPPLLFVAEAAAHNGGVLVFISRTNMSVTLLASVVQLRLLAADANAAIRNEPANCESGAQLRGEIIQRGADCGAVRGRSSVTTQHENFLF